MREIVRGKRCAADALRVSARLEFGEQLQYERRINQRV
jgi:hypothetical protein